MAFANSGMYVTNWVNFLKNTAPVINLDAETHKCALYTNTLSPNFSTDTAYAATNEISGAGYTAGGATLTSTTVTESPAGAVMWDAADVAWTSATLSAVRGAIIYADALTPKALIAAVTFGADFAVTAGTFTIVWAATGILVWDITP